MDRNLPCDLISAKKLSHAYGNMANKAVGPNYDLQPDHMHAAPKDVVQNYELKAEKPQLLPTYGMPNPHSANDFSMDKSVCIYGNCGKSMTNYNNMTTESSGRTYNALKTVEMPFGSISSNPNLCTSNTNLCTSNANLCTNNTNLCTSNANLCTSNANLCTSNASLCTSNASTVQAPNMNVPSSYGNHNVNANNPSCASNSNLTSSASSYMPAGSSNMYIQLTASNTNSSNSASCFSSNSNTSCNASCNVTNVTMGPPKVNLCCDNENCPNNTGVIEVRNSKKPRKKKAKEGEDQTEEGKEGEDGKEKKPKTKKPKGKRISIPPSDPDSLLSLPETRQKWSHLTLNEKAIAINVYKFVKKVSMPFKKEIMETTAEIMGVSISTIYGILKEYKTTGKVTVPPRHPPPDRGIVEKLDEGTLMAIKTKINGLFVLHNKLPSLSKVLAAVNEDPMLPNFSRTTMYRILKKMNFCTPKPKPKGGGKKKDGVNNADKQNMLMLGNNYDVNPHNPGNVSVIRGAEKPRKMTKKQKESLLSEINLSREHMPMQYRLLES